MESLKIEDESQKLYCIINKSNDNFITLIEPMINESFEKNKKLLINLKENIIEVEFITKSNVYRRKVDITITIKKMLKEFENSINKSDSFAFYYNGKQIWYDEIQVKYVIKEKKPRLFCYRAGFTCGFTGPKAYIDFFEIKESNEIDLNFSRELTGILKLCILKYISKFVNQEIRKKIKFNIIKDIITSLQNNINYKDDIQENIKAILQEKNGKNIFNYLHFINENIDNNKILDLINLFEESIQNKIKIFYNKLLDYENFNLLFEKEFLKALYESYFDYSVINIVICEKNNREEYLKGKKKCPNCQTKYLYHGTQIDPISKIITNTFLYTKKAFYGMGIYFSDMLDYISFYCGGQNFSDRRVNFNKLIPIDYTFSIVASEIYYDEEKKKNIYDFSYYVKELKDFPTYDEIKRKYSNKMIEKNGIHFIRVEPKKGHPRSEIQILEDKSNGQFLGNEYAITEMQQIFPLYGITLKRNEYFILWRDPYFYKENQFKLYGYIRDASENKKYDYNMTRVFDNNFDRFYNYLKKRVFFLDNNVNMNIYLESSTEEAIKLIKRKKYNKIILITSIGLDLSGKRFVEIARKILGFKAVVLFFSENQNHLKWIKEFDNALYTNNGIFFQEYILHFNEKGLKDLKKKIEKKYTIELKKFTEDFLNYPNFIKQNGYNNLIFDEISDYYKEVLIYNKESKLFLVMEKDEVFAKNKNNKKDITHYIWYITILDKEITLFSNSFYLSIDKYGKNIIGHLFMKIWKINRNNNKNFDKGFSIEYNWYNSRKILTLKDKQLMAQEKDDKEHQTFYFIEII